MSWQCSRSSPASLRALAARQALVPAYSMLCFGFLTFVAVRNEVQAELGEIVQRRQPAPLDFRVQFDPDALVSLGGLCSRRDLLE